ADSSASASSPNNNCPICLGQLENKSFTDSCFHTFCFVCLLEWSKVKAVCPLCKQQFKSIIHSVRSIEDYDQY
ncbi:E3 ubiquitin-protein ligase Topors, partial [Lamellibrachia satsuma]